MFSPVGGPFRASSTLRNFASRSRRGNGGGNSAATPGAVFAPPPSSSSSSNAGSSMSGNAGGGIVLPSFEDSSTTMRTLKSTDADTFYFGHDLRASVRAAATSSTSRGGGSDGERGGHSSHRHKAANVNLFCRLCQQEIVAPMTPRGHILSTARSSHLNHNVRETVLDHLALLVRRGYNAETQLQVWSRVLYDHPAFPRLRSLCSPHWTLQERADRLVVQFRQLRDLGILDFVFAAVAPEAQQNELVMLHVKRRVAMERAEIIGDNCWGPHMSRRMFLAFPDKQFGNSQFNYNYNTFRDACEMNTTLEWFYDTLNVTELFPMHLRDKLGMGKLKADILEAFFGELHLHLWGYEPILYETAPYVEVNGVGEGPLTSWIQHVLTEMYDLLFLHFLQELMEQAIPLANELGAEFLWRVRNPPLTSHKDRTGSLRRRNWSAQANLAKQVALPAVFPLASISTSSSSSSPVVIANIATTPVASAEAGLQKHRSASPTENVESEVPPTAPVTATTPSSSRSWSQSLPLRVPSYQIPELIDSRTGKDVFRLIIAAQHSTGASEWQHPRSSALQTQRPSWRGLIRSLKLGLSSSPTLGLPLPPPVLPDDSSSVDPLNSNGSLRSSTAGMVVHGDDMIMSPLGSDSPFGGGDDATHHGDDPSSLLLEDEHRYFRDQYFHLSAEPHHQEEGDACRLSDRYWSVVEYDHEVRILKQKGPLAATGTMRPSVAANLTSNNNGLLQDVPNQTAATTSAINRTATTEADAADRSTSNEESDAAAAATTVVAAAPTEVAAPVSLLTLTKRYAFPFLQEAPIVLDSTGSEGASGEAGNRGANPLEFFKSAFVAASVKAPAAGVVTDKNLSFGVFFVEMFEKQYRIAMKNKTARRKQLTLDSAAVPAAAENTAALELNTSLSTASTPTLVVDNQTVVPAPEGDPTATPAAATPSESSANDTAAIATTPLSSLLLFPAEEEKHLKEQLTQQWRRRWSTENKFFGVVPMMQVVGKKEDVDEEVVGEVVENDEADAGSDPVDEVDETNTSNAQQSTTDADASGTIQ